MASPVAHSLVGATLYFALSRNRKFDAREFWLVILAANIADLDFIPGFFIGDPEAFHRTISHSLVVTLLFSLMVYVMLRLAQSGHSMRLSVLIFLGLLSQLAIDWLSFDDSPPQGVPLMWPFTGDYYMSDVHVFSHVRRDNLFSVPVILHNLKAIAREIMIVAPVTFIVWRTTKYFRARSGRTQPGVQI